MQGETMRLTRTAINWILLGIASFFISLISATVCFGDELPPTIILPTRTVTSDASPTTVTTVEIIDTIEPGVWYVIRSKIPLFVLDSPQGSVSIISGAASVDGIFAGGDGKSETRVFDPSESTYLIQGLKPCKTELIMIPVGVEERQDIERQILTVSCPRPPPDDDVIPDPDPKPTPTPKAKHVRLAIVEDTLNRSPDTAILMNALVGWNEFLDAGNEWRQYDKSTGEAKGVKAKADAGTIPLPAMVFYDLESGKLLKAAPLSKTFAELKTTIGELTNE
jgi:hypothetical protein